MKKIIKGAKGTFIYNKRKEQSYKEKLPHTKWITMADSNTRKREEMIKIISVAQASKRLKWNMAVSFSAKFKDVLNFRAAQVKNMTSVNYLVKQILKNAIEGDYPYHRISYPNVVISDGCLYPLAYPKLTISETGLCRLNWLLFPDYAEVSDFLSLVIYNKTKEQVDLLKEVALRGELNHLFQCPSFDQGDELHCWGFLASRSPKMISKSEYIPIIRSAKKT